MSEIKVRTSRALLVERIGYWLEEHPDGSFDEACRGAHVSDPDWCRRLVAEAALYGDVGRDHPVVDLYHQEMRMPGLVAEERE